MFYIFMATSITWTQTLGPDNGPKPWTLDPGPGLWTLNPEPGPWTRTQDPDPENLDPENLDHNKLGP